MNRTLAETDLLSQITLVGRDLRRALSALLSELAGGQHPRPTRLSRAIGLDKSLASRLVRALQTTSDLELVHIVPSPAGLRILAESATHFVEGARIRDLLVATNQFERLLEGTPGGRAAIDAQIAEGSHVVRTRSEQVARQAAFKSMSYLLGQFCDLLSTTLFLVPSANGRTVDGIEFHRRLGLRRMRPSTPLAILSLNMDSEEQKGDTIRFEDIDGSDHSNDPSRFLIPEASSKPLPETQVLREGTLTTLLVGGDPSLKVPSRLSWAFCIRNGWPLHPEGETMSLRGYALHIPCRRMVRDIYVAESLWPGCSPRITWSIPGPRNITPAPSDSGPRHFTTIDLNAPIEQLPGGSSGYDVAGFSDHDSATRYVLDMAGHEKTRFRGWRCSMTYPVPLIEMKWWLTGYRAP
jgi:hypothetical protein